LQTVRHRFNIYAYT